MEKSIKNYIHEKAQRSPNSIISMFFGINQDFEIDEDEKMWVFVLIILRAFLFLTLINIRKATRESDRECPLKLSRLSREELSRMF